MDSNAKDLQPIAPIRYVVGVAAGKGGVGKSTLALQLAHCLKSRKWKVGLLDADLYGPSLRMMLPEDELPRQHPHIPDRIIPAVGQGIQFISMAHFLKEGDCASVRAPIANGIIKQFIHNVEWGDLDCLLIDFPPGTGDIQLTLMQEARLSGGVVITTPQEIALLDVAKAVLMTQQMQVPILGVVENMSYFTDPTSGQHSFPFGRGGGEKFALENDLFFLGRIPLDPLISQCCDRGISLLEHKPPAQVVEHFNSICTALMEQLESFARLERIPHS